MRVILVVLILVFSNLCGFCEKLSGEVSKQGELERNTVVEQETGAGVGNARVSVPAQNFDTVTDQTGGFNIPASMIPPYIMSVKKDGYKPFSMTVTEKALAAPLLLQIEKATQKQLLLMLRCAISEMMIIQIIPLMPVISAFEAAARFFAKILQ